jgi:cysteine-rich repeat protein
MAGDEECDDGNTVDNDGCDADCVPSEVVQVETGAEHTCVRTRTGAVRCWGRGQFGRLGYGNSDDIGDDELASSAGDIDLGGPAIDISAGGFHTCAVLEGGAVRCWGRSDFGQLGYANTDSVGDDETPASAGDVNLGANAARVFTGTQSTCALLTDGNIRCWGIAGATGYPGGETIGDDETPASMGNVDVGGTVETLGLGGNTCAVLTGGALQCWGGNGNNQLGDPTAVGAYGDDETPAEAPNVPLGALAAGVDNGSTRVCALTTVGEVRCWGSAGSGGLGYGDTETIGDDETPADAGSISLGGTATDVYVGANHFCALIDNGDVRCWGLPDNGELGLGNNNTVLTPSDVGPIDLGGTAVQLDLDFRHACVLLDTGGVRCWGSGLFGVLGRGNTDPIGDDETPASAGDVPVF